MESTKKAYRLNPGLVLAVLTVALVSFEISNASLTQFALEDLLGDLRFFDIAWSVVLTIAFMGIDFAPFSALFVMENKSVHLLLVGWLIAVVFNAGLVWWALDFKLQAMNLSWLAIIIAFLVPILRIILFAGLYVSLKESCSSE